MKKTIKVIFIVLILITVFTKSVSAFSIGDIWDWGKDFIQAGEEVTEQIDPDTINQLSNTIFSILQVVAMASAVIMLSVIGIKFMTGTVEEKANAQKTLVPLIVGCFIAFAAFTIWKLVLNILQSTNI